MAEIHVQIWDANGNLVVDRIEEAQTATQEQIDQMVSMIEQGCPAFVAAAIVTNS